MYYLNRKVLKSVIAIFIVTVANLFFPYRSCLAEEQAPDNTTSSSEATESPSNTNNNLQNNPPIANNNSANNKKQIINKKNNAKITNNNHSNEEKLNQSYQEQNSEEINQTQNSNENPSVKSKKIPVNKNDKETNQNSSSTSDKKGTNEPKISLPDVLPEDIAPTNEISPTYNYEEGQINFIKSIIAWGLISIGVVIILFVIFSNRKINSRSSNVFIRKNNFKSKFKN